MNVLLLGSGGRETSLAWKISQSKLLNRLFIIPGNVGTAKYGTNVSISLKDINAIKEFIDEESIDMLIVGPEEPLVNGIYDQLVTIPRFKNLKIIGPSTMGAKLEGSKSFAKTFMNRHSIPTANYRYFNKNYLYEGIEYIKKQKPPIVIKADGLAAGKGVVICETIEEAEK